MSQPGSPVLTTPTKVKSPPPDLVLCNTPSSRSSSRTQSKFPVHSPTPIRNGFLSPSIERGAFDLASIGINIPLPISPGPPSPTPSNRSRLLTRSPSPSPRRTSFASPRMSHESLASSPPYSPTPRSLRMESLSSPPPRIPAFKSASPSTPGNDADDMESSAPFESIPLGNTPPGTSVPLPMSPMSATPSGSDHGFRRGSAQRSGSSLALGTTSPRSQSYIPNGETIEVPHAGPSTPPRRHAPPAHPHPYPLPYENGTSVPPAATNGDTNAGPSHVAPALGTKGPSAFEKVRSHTRPAHLPPKDKAEDDSHLHLWEDMMSQAKDHERERRKQTEARRLEREKKLAQNTPRWEELLGPGFSVAKVKDDGGLKRLWFEGVPSHLRGKAWSLAIGNPLAMAKDSYKVYLARARKSVDAGRFPTTVLEQMEKDMDVTLPKLRLYVRGSPMRDDLREFLCAWMVYRSDEGLGYAPYITHLAAMFLLNSPPPIAFLSLVNLLSRPCLRAYISQQQDEIEGYYRVFENLEADTFPKIFANCKNMGVKLPESYFRSLFLEQVPFEACCRLWDQIVLNGDGYIFRAALAIISFLEPRLHFPEHEEIAAVFEGRNKASLLIQEREKERAKLRGEAYDETVDGTLDVFGLNEGILFDWLENDGWREARFERLASRELPD